MDGWKFSFLTSSVGQALSVQILVQAICIPADMAAFNNLLSIMNYVFIIMNLHIRGPQEE